MSVKPILLIAGCRKYEEYLHAAIRRMTRSEWTVIGIRGLAVGTDGSDHTSAVFDASTNILTLPIADTYEALPAKLHAAYKWIYENHPGIPGIFKTDDDMLFDINKLVSAVQKHKALPYWGITASICKSGPINTGRIESRFADPTLRPIHQSAIYCFGAGYWMAASTLPSIAAATADYAASALEDVCTGYVMNRAGIMPTKIILPHQEFARCKQLLDIK
jgi:hypothetical protein